MKIEMINLRRIIREQLAGQTPRDEALALIDKKLPEAREQAIRMKLAANTSILRDWIFTDLTDERKIIGWNSLSELEESV
tara:strand:- start:861 stop:1100 length:240 start_codon:yes stop_codon:yes gene_type:complete